MHVLHQLGWWHLGTAIATRRRQNIVSRSCQFFRLLITAATLSPGLLAAERLCQADEVERLVFQSQPRPLQHVPLETRWIAFSDDGKLAASAHGRWTTGGCVRLWDLATNEPLAEFPQRRGVSCVAFSPDSRYLAYAGWDGSATILDVQSRKAISCSVGGVSRLAFAPDGKLLVTATERSQEVTFWDAATGKKIRLLQGQLFRFNDVAFSPDGKRVAAAGGSLEGAKDGRIALWDTAEGRQLKVIDAHGVPVTRVVFSPDGATLASGSLDGTVSLWNVESAELKLSLGPHDGGVRSVGFSPDGRLLASVSDEGDIRLWNAASGEESGEFDHEERGLLATVFSPDGKTLATGGADGVVRLWSVAERRLTGMLQSRPAQRDPAQPVLFFACCPDGKRIASSHEGDFKVRVRDAATGDVLFGLEGHTDNVTCVAYSPDGKRMATASCDGTARLWDAATGECQKTLAGHGGWVFGVTFSPDGQTIATAGRDKSVRLWRVRDGEALATLEGHTDLVRSVAFSPDGATLASASSDQSVRLWDVESRKERKLLTAAEGTSAAIAFSPDGTTLADAGKTGSVTLWNVATGTVQTILSGHRSAAWCVAFSRQGTTLATSGFDGNIILWDLKSHQVRTTLRGHKSVVTSLAFLPDGTALVSGSADATLQRWDAATPVLATLRGSGDEIRLVRFSPDGRSLVVAGVGTRVLVYDVDTGNLRHTLEQASSAFAGDLTADGKLLAVCSTEIGLWDMESGRRIGELGKGDLSIRGVAFTPDATALVSGNDGGIIQVWDLATRKVQRAFPQQPLNIYDLAVSPDGKTLATATGDYKRPMESGEVKLWDLQSGRQLQIVPGGSTWYYDVDFAPDGRRLIFSDADGFVRIWNIERRELETEMHCDKRVRACELIPPADRLLAAGNPGRLTIWDIASDQCIVQCEDLAEMSFCIAVSPDGSVAASGGADPHVRLWEIPTTHVEGQTTADQIRTWPSPQPAP